MAALKLGVGYTYFGGMVTALFPMIPAIIMAASIFAEGRASQASPATLARAAPAAA
jgi:hypothetical protein